MPSSRFLYSSGRIAFIQILFVLGFLLLVIRLIYLQLFQDVFLDGQVLSRSYSEYSLLAPRGRILDRENNILAFDVISYSVGIDFSKFKKKESIAALSEILNVEEKRLALKTAIAHMEAQSGGHALRTAKDSVKLREEELRIAEEQLKVFSNQEFAKSRPTMRDVAGFTPPRAEIKADNTVQSIIDANKTELDLLTEKNDKEFALVKEQIQRLQQAKVEAQLGRGRELNEAELVLLDELHETKVAMELTFQEKVTAIAQAEAAKREKFNQQNLSKFKAGKFQEIDIAGMTEKEKGQFVKDSARSTLQEAAKMNKKMFRLNQALNIGEAIMNTAAGVSKALAQGGMFGIPMAIAIGAMGAIQVATIASQQPPAQFGGSRLPNSPFLVGEKGPELFTPATAGTVTPNHQLGGGGATVNFNITTVDAQSFGALLDTRRGQIVNMINSALNNKGQAALV